MSLHSHVSHPSARSYVLKLHRDAAPQHGHWIGRLEHMSSGRSFEFHSAEELLSCLARDLAQAAADADAAAAEAGAPAGGTERR
jgi:hypothetical protein